MYNVTLLHVRNPCCSGKAITTTYFEHALIALGIQHAMHMHHVACAALQYLSTLSHKQHNIQKKVIEHKMYVLIFFTTFF